MALRASTALIVVVALAAGCGSHKSTTTAADAPILGGPAQPVDYAAVRSAVDDVYKSHPKVVSYAVRDVTYTPATRDRVLAVCRRGGGSTTKRELEASRVAGCAPLIFFFYRYGRSASAADSTDLARKLYWYAATNVKGPFDAKASLDALLTSWGVK